MRGFDFINFDRDCIAYVKMLAGEARDYDEARALADKELKASKDHANVQA